MKTKNQTKQNKKINKLKTSMHCERHGQYEQKTRPWLGEKYFQNICEKALLLKVFKEFLKLNSKKTI